MLSPSLRAQKLARLAQGEGYRTIGDLLNCGWCDQCATATVHSALVLGGII